jgi:hypothetical protein
VIYNENKYNSDAALKQAALLQQSETTDNYQIKQVGDIPDQAGLESTPKYVPMKKLFDDHTKAQPFVKSPKSPK